MFLNALFNGVATFSHLLAAGFTSLGLAFLTALGVDMQITHQDIWNAYMHDDDKPIITQEESKKSTGLWRLAISNGIKVTKGEIKRHVDKSESVEGYCGGNYPGKYSKFF